MNLTILKTIGGPKVQRALFKVSKYAPEILTGVGIVGIITSTIMIAKATTELEPIVDKFEHRKESSKIRKENSLLTHSDDYTNKEYQKDLVYVYAHGILDLTKLYGPGVSLSLASIASILAAHGLMHRRSVALLGAYKAVESAFSAYRQRVIEEYGEDKDRDFRTGFRTEVIEDKETGKKKKVRSFDPTDISPYARFFDEFNSNWRRVPEYNLAFLKNQQNYANDLLRARGHIFLNEIYDMLGTERSHAGQVVGWAITKDTGDNYVDFNIYNTDSVAARDFVNGVETSILLDFNVDGVIIDLI